MNLLINQWVPVQHTICNYNAQIFHTRPINLFAVKLYLIVDQHKYSIIQVNMYQELDNDISYQTMQSSRDNTSLPGCT